MFHRKEAAGQSKRPVAKGEPNSTGPGKSAASNAQSAQARVRDSDNSDGVVLIGRNTHIVGEISNCSVVEIEGGLQGNLVADRLIVHEGGSAQGNLHAAEVEVRGYVDGDVSVQGLLDVRATGQITGKLVYGRLSVANGGFVQGNLHTQGQVDRTDPDAAAHQSDTALEHSANDQRARSESAGTNGHAIDIHSKRSEQSVPQPFSLEAAARRH